ncbi:MAG: hypothetical protein K2M72_03475 [Paramuribaculum sp.]|nr:hypothetical protein [Paramuribaculum sp.]
MKSFVLFSLNRNNADEAQAYTTLIPSPDINVHNKYMLFDDGFIRREHASVNEPKYITVIDRNGNLLGTFTRGEDVVIGRTCIWSIDNDPNKELVIRRLKAITEPSTAKDYFKWLQSQNNIPAQSLNYLLGESASEGYGTIKNLLKASRYFLAGMEAGDSGCKVAYANLLLKGWFGQQQDLPQAISYLESAGNEGNLLAKSHLANLYLDNRNLPGSSDKVVQIGLELMDSAEEFMSDNIIKEMAMYYSNPANPRYDKNRAIELYSKLDPDVTLKEFAFLIVDDEEAGKDASRKELEEKAFLLLNRANNQKFKAEDGSEDMRCALLCRCNRLGIGTPENLRNSIEPNRCISISKCHLAMGFSERRKKAIKRRAYEQLLSAIEFAYLDIKNTPSTTDSYLRYGSLLEYLGYLKEFSKEGMPYASVEISKLSGIIDNLGSEYAEGYKQVIIERNRKEEEAARKRQMWEEQERQRRLREEEEARERKRREAEEEERAWRRELERRQEEKRVMGLIDVAFDFTWVKRDDDFDDDPIENWDEKYKIIPQETYSALLIGGENAIKSYVAGFFRDPSEITILKATMKRVD